MIEKLNPHYSMTAKASIYDEEALTALELAARTTGKVNEVVERANKIPQDVENAVDNVLNGGTFDKLIDRKLDTLGTRFDNLAGKLTAGSTTFDAEIVDARVDSSGHVYSNLGAAVRGLEAQTKREIDRFVSVNRLNPDTTVLGYIDPVHGVISENTDYRTTDFIAIAEDETLGLFYDYSNMSDGGITPRQMRFVCAYDKNKQLLSTMGATDVLGYRQAGDVGFVRITFKNTRPDRLMVCNTDTTSFAAYGEGKLVESVIPDNVKNVTEGIVYTNRYHTDGKEIGVYANYLTGMLHENPDYFTTGFIRVYEGERLSLFNKEMTALPVRMGIWYDSEGKFMSGFSVESTIITVPVGACYVRFSVKNEYDERELMLADTDAPKFVPVGSYALRVSAGASVSERPNKVASFTASEVAEGETVYLNEFPKYVQSDFTLNFFARIPYGGNLIIGKGGPDAPEYGSSWLEISDAHITGYEHTTETVKIFENANPFHMADYLYIQLSVNYRELIVKIKTLTTQEGLMHDNDTVEMAMDSSGCFAGVPFIKANKTLWNVSFSATSKSFDEKTWIFGDSYTGKALDRVYGSVLEYFYRGAPVLVASRPGLGSVGAYDDLIKALKFGKPKTLVWYVGINDDYNTYAAYLPTVHEICATNNIDLVVNEIPSTPTLDRAQHRQLAHDLGTRLVGSWSAINENEYWATENGLQILAEDNTHPTEKGATLLAARLLADVPEIMIGG